MTKHLPSQSKKPAPHAAPHHAPKHATSHVTNREYISESGKGPHYYLELSDGAHSINVFENSLSIDGTNYFNLPKICDGIRESYRCMSPEQLNNVEEALVKIIPAHHALVTKHYDDYNHGRPTKPLLMSSAEEASLTSKESNELLGMMQPCATPKTKPAVRVKN